MDEIIHQPIPCATLVADWVQVSFDNGDVSLGLAKTAVLGFLDRNWWLKGHFAIVWECIKSWEDGEPFDSRRPWPPVLLKGLVCLVCLAALWGWWATLTQLWLEYHCLLRPGEGCALLWVDLSLPEDLDGFMSCWAGVVGIRKPKTRRIAARRQMVLITDPWLIWWLRGLREVFSVVPTDPLFSYGPSVSNTRIKRPLKAVGVEARLFTAGGLRAGGATRMLRAGASPEWLLHRGRWESFLSLRRYLQECGAVLAEQSMPFQVRVLLTRLASECPTVRTADVSTILAGVLAKC